MTYRRNSYTPAPPQHSFSGTIAPVFLPLCRIPPSFYPRMFFYLRAQKTVLHSLRKAIDELDIEDNPDDSFALGIFRQILQTLMNADYATVFQYALGAVTEIKACLAKELSQQIEKIGYQMLSASLSISRLLTLISYSTSSPMIPEDQLVKPVVKSRSPTKDVERPEIKEEKNEKFFKTPQRGSLTPRLEKEQSMVVCRICEKKVPLFLIETHSRNCAMAYESSKTTVSSDDRMRKLQALARQTILRCKWPGAEERAVNVIIPVLHIVVLLDRAIMCDPKNPCAADELDMICESIVPIQLSMLNSEAANILKKANSLIADKLNATNQLTEAISVLRGTSVAPEEESDMSVGQTTIADFIFMKRISSGAYARVFLAKKNRTGDIYAVKVLPKTGLRQKNEVRRVLIEKDILLKVSSPYMIKFFYSIIGENNLYLVMEYLPGGDLYSLLQNIGSLSEESAKIYSAQIVAALEFLRENNIIHRDLKPDNILVDATGHLKLTDFGLSYFGMVDRSISTVPGKQAFDDAFVGTPDYTSPEIVLSQPHTFTADYWALGTILYEFLTGIPPFHGETPAQTFQNIIKGHYDVDELADCSPEVVDFISKLLSQDPERRLGAQSIEEIKQHPWFADIDWDNIESLTPPFVPDLNGKLDTSYFEERYEFPNRDESDILADIKHIETIQGVPREETHRTSILSLLDEPLDDDCEENEIDSFSSVAVHQLQATTNEDARQLRKKSGLSMDILASPGENADVQFTPPKKKGRRRYPRVSLSPKITSPATRSPGYLASPMTDSSMMFDDSD